jgi:hypothetical protein
MRAVCHVIEDFYAATVSNNMLPGNRQAEAGTLDVAAGSLLTMKKFIEYPAFVFFGDARTTIYDIQQQHFIIPLKTDFYGPTRRGEFDGVG